MLLMLRTNTHLNTTLGNFTRFNLLIDILIFIYQIFNIKTHSQVICFHMPCDTFQYQDLGQSQLCMKWYLVGLKVL